MMKHVSLTAIAAVAFVVLSSSAIVCAAPAASGESGVSNGSVSAADAGAPVYPGGKPINGGLLKVTLYSKVTGTNVTFSTPDSFEKVYNFYKHALPAKTESTVTNGDPSSRIATFTYTKGDGSKIDIEIRAYPGHTNYTINDTYKK